MEKNESTKIAEFLNNLTEGNYAKADANIKEILEIKIENSVKEISKKNK